MQVIQINIIFIIIINIIIVKSDFNISKIMDKFGCVQVLECLVARHSHGCL